jgi:putative membrane protein
MPYENYHYWGMNLIWWVVWVILLFWIFASPYPIPGQKSKKDTPLDVLKSEQEYLEKKKIIQG